MISQNSKLNAHSYSQHVLLVAWQIECLTLPAVRDGLNLIYSLPTSGGKTLVAEMLIFRQLLCYHSDALLILPFVALVQEKVNDVHLSAVAADSGIYSMVFSLSMHMLACFSYYLIFCLTLTIVHNYGTVCPESRSF